MKVRIFKKSNETLRVTDAAVPLDKVDPLTRYLGGIRTVIVRIKLNRNIDDKVIKKFDLKKFKLAGRYYTAKVFGRRGQLVDEVLIDKQTGTIQSVLGITGAVS